MDASGSDSGIKKTRSANQRTGRLKHLGGGNALMLTSMLDILTTILFFLLKNYSTVISDFHVGKDITLPQSSALLPPAPALQLVVTQKEILLDDKPLAQIVNGDIEKSALLADGVTIVPLAQELKEQKARSQYIATRNEDHTFTGTLVLQADKTIPYHLLKKVIYTAGISDFVNLKLAVLKKEDSSI